MDTVVAPASAEAAATAVADIREERERVSKYLTRLREVRHKRSAMEVCCALHCTALHCTLICITLYQYFEKAALISCSNIE